MELTVWYSDFKSFEDLAQNLATWIACKILKVVRITENFMIVRATKGNEWAINGLYK